MTSIEQFFERPIPERLDEIASELECGKGQNCLQRVNSAIKERDDE